MLGWPMAGLELSPGLWISEVMFMTAASSHPLPHVEESHHPIPAPTWQALESICQRSEKQRGHWSIPWDAGCSWSILWDAGCSWRGQPKPGQRGLGRDVACTGQPAPTFPAGPFPLTVFTGGIFQGVTYRTACLGGPEALGRYSQGEPSWLGALALHILDRGKAYTGC